MYSIILILFTFILALTLKLINNLRPENLNNTNSAEIDVLFLNRIPKTGSEKLIELLKNLGNLHNFNVFREPPYTPILTTLDSDQQRNLSADISEINEPTAYIMHVNYINFTRFNQPRPIYINLIMDPVERIISWFYYRRAPWILLKHQKYSKYWKERPQAWYKKSFEECVRSGDKECLYDEGSTKMVGDYRRQTMFFCGHDPACLPFNTDVPLQMAKRIVEEEYAVVGTWEDKKVTLAVLEDYIPMFFTGASSLVHMNQNGPQNDIRKHSMLKPRISEEIKEIMQSLNARDLNNTRKAGVEIVFFNRVPKVGSQTFMELLRQLAARNEFEFHRDAVQRVETIRLGEDQQQELAEVIADLPEPSVFIKHVCHTNFTKFNLPTPIYINVVRDPIERVISWFYYVRAPWYFVERKAAFPELPLPDPAWLKKDFETCVRMGDKECTFTQGVTHEGIGDHRRQTLFFCGHDYECTPFNTVGALERAKYAVESQYAVVGVLEDLNTTLTVLEKYIPKFFTGASEVYFGSSERLNKINRNSFKPPVSEEVKEIVRRNFTMEIEFYQFCKQRLHKQFLAVSLPQRLLGNP